MSLSNSESRAIVYTEKFSSTLSVLASAFVIITFLSDSKFRKPINRLVFYATLGNILSNVATMLSRSGIEAGEESSLCHFQAFLIQWFMPADALWTFAMACNVYLSFFHQYDATSLRSLEPKYFAFCYGVPFVPAFLYFFVGSATRGRVYGEAVLWCWVSMKWDILRVATFYGPVWIVILLTVGIYLKVGAVILKWRKHLLSFDNQPDVGTETPTSGIRKTYEVTVTCAGAYEGSEHTVDICYDGFGLKSPMYARTISKGFAKQVTKRNLRQRTHSTGVDPNKAALKYCKCAVLFFLALLVTWVPSTVNRIYTIVRPDEVIFGLNLAAALVLPLQGFWNAAVYIATSMYACRSALQKTRSCWHRRQTQTGISFKMKRQGRSLGSRDMQMTLTQI